MANDRRDRLRREMSATAAQPGDALRQIGERLELVRKQLGTVARAAEFAGVHPNQFSRYVKGENETSVLPMVALAAKADVSLDWLLAGLGPMRRSDAGLNDTLLAQVITALERQLAERRVTLTPEKKGEAVVLLYQMFSDSKPNDAQAQTQVGRVLRLVVG